MPSLPLRRSATLPRAAALLVALVIPARAASAQGGLIEGLVRNASDVNVSLVLDRIPSSSAAKVLGGTARGVGFEITYEVPGAESLLAAREKGAPGALEIGVGYSQSGAFGARAAGDQISFAVRDLPSLSVYVSPVGGLRLFRVKKTPVTITPYGGLRTGILSIVGGRAYTDSLVYKLEGQAFQLGGLGGLTLDLGPVSLIGEAIYAWRNFQSLDWTVPSKALPSTFPRALDLTGLHVSFGLSVPLKKHEGR